MTSSIKISSFMDTVRSAPLLRSEGGLPVLQSEEEEYETLCPSLTYEQRLIGFCVCFCLGFLFSIFAWISLFSLDLETFAVINTLASLTSIGSTLFLCGPMAQAKRMFSPTRRAATVVYLSAMVLTFVVALVFEILWLTVSTSLVQYVAMLWYSISYIPFARTAVKKLLGFE